MSAVIAARFRPISSRQPIPVSLDPDAFTFELERDCDGEGLIKLARVRIRSMLYNDGHPLTCLSCGAKTQPDGSLPCGH